MKVELQIDMPTEAMRESFFNYIRHDVNAARQRLGLPMVDSEQSHIFLSAAWQFFNKHGVLKPVSA